MVVANLGHWTPRWLLVAAIAALPCIAEPAGADAPAAADLPAGTNIVFILLDDVGWGDLGAYGGTAIATPRMDEIARDGRIFANYYVNGAVCSPTRVGILTGQHPSRHNIRHATWSGSTFGLSDDAPTLPRLLSTRGYTSGHFGKWHLGDADPSRMPLAQGFDTSAMRPDGGQDYWSPLFMIDDVEPVLHSDAHVTEITTDYAIRFITENAAGPFFANIWYNAPHRPYQPTPASMVPYPDTPEGQYSALVNHADSEIGRLLDVLASLGIEDETLVIVSSDNGSIQANLSSNGPYRGVKTEMFEGGIRSPLIIRMPGHVPAGTTVDTVVVGFDFVPTLAALLGIDAAGLNLDGGDLSAAFLDEVPPRRNASPIFWESKESTSYFNPPTGELNRYAVRKDSWKLVRQDNDVHLSPRLYDLSTDPHEQSDVSQTNLDEVAELEAAYRAWRLSTTRIDHVIAETIGDVTVVGGSYRFGAGEGRIELGPDSRLDIGTRDFTFRARITPDSTGPARSIIATHPNAWSLYIDSDGKVGADVMGPRGSTTLRGDTVLVPGVGYDVALTIFSWRFSENSIRLFVDGIIEDEQNAIPHVRPSSDPVSLGASPIDPPRSFHGTISEANFYQMAMNPREIGGDVDGDGVQNVDDNCLDVPNASQVDSDADRFGNACDADYDNDGFVDVQDAEILDSSLFLCSLHPDYLAIADSDGNSCVGISEFVFFRTAVFRKPGPSGLGCGEDRDRDGDAVCDPVDNCLLSRNPTQRDSDRDGYGNACDADYDNDGGVALPDWRMLKAAFSTCLGHPDFQPALDSEGDGCIGPADFYFFKEALGKSPGPSALH